MVKNTILVQKSLLVSSRLMKKPGGEIELLPGQCSICNRRKSMIVSDNTIEAVGLVDLFKNLDKNVLMYQKLGKKRFKKTLTTFKNRYQRWYHICISKS